MVFIIGIFITGNIIIDNDSTLRLAGFGAVTPLSDVTEQRISGRAFRETGAEGFVLEGS